MRGILAVVVAWALAGSAWAADRFYEDGYREAGNKNVIHVLIDPDEVPKDIDAWIKVATEGQAARTKAKGLTVLAKIGNHSGSEVVDDDADKILKVISSGAATADDNTRRWIAGGIAGLAQRAEKSPEAIKTYTRLLSDQDDNVRNTALQNAGNIKCDQMISALTVIAKNKKLEDNPRSSAIEAISHIGGSKARAALVDLIKTLPADLAETAKEGIDKIDGLK